MRYLSYLVRLWDAGGREAPHWQASLEDPHTGERLGFADLESLWAFLVEQTRPDSPQETEFHPPDAEPG